MNGHALVLAVFLGVSSTAVAEAPESPKAASAAELDERPVPAWVPRGVSVGVFFNLPTVAPHLRLSWELGFFERPRNDFVAIVTLGTGAAVSLPPGFAENFQHVALVGLGYRSNHDVWQWGFQIVAGPVWYRASFIPAARQPFESRVLPYTEGRLQLGMRILPHLIIGLYGGYASPWDFDPRYPGNMLVGGPLAGVYADWR
jgi:hypothetical protein